MNSISQIPNWHVWLYGILFAFEAVCAAVVAGAIDVPPGLHNVAPYAGIVVVFLTAFLPRIQTQTGPGAPPILSPPARPNLPVTHG